MKLIKRTPTYLLTLLLGLIPLLGQAEEHGGKEGTYPGYLALEPSLVVNLASEHRTKYLRVEIQFYLETSQDAELARLHMPLIRDRLITLLGGRESDQIMSAEAREQLRAELLAKLRETMIKQTGSPTISALYFTGFIIQ